MSDKLFVTVHCIFLLLLLGMFLFTNNAPAYITNWGYDYMEAALMYSSLRMMANSYLKTVNKRPMRPIATLAVILAVSFTLETLQLSKHEVFSITGVYDPLDYVAYTAGGVTMFLIDYISRGVSNR